MYTFKNTEINNKKASEFETKALLYLIGVRTDRDEIELITVDCFNDVTGVNEDFSKLWDVQSKNHQSFPPSKIGESLLTLYNNFISDFDFSSYILFVPPLNRDYLIDTTLSSYGYDNINDKQKKGIEKKLCDKIAVENRGKPPLFDDFLNHVTFVEDNKKISTYIKSIARFKNKKLISEELYESIFNEIRDVQTGLKNSFIENETIAQPKEVLKYNRHITKREINTLLISRLIGVEIFDISGFIPIPFLPVTSSLDSETVRDLLQVCNENLSRAFFDKNGCRNFWKVSEFIIQYTRENTRDDIYGVYQALLSKIKITTNYLTKETVLYMISLVKTGIDNEN